VEQRLARQAHNLEVVGSIPTGATFSPRYETNIPELRGFFMRLTKRLAMGSRNKQSAVPAAISYRCDTHCAVLS
jgi:hypothetical protein